MECGNKKMKVINNKMPEKMKYFKEDLMSKIISVPVQKPDINKILRIISEVTIIDTEIIETEVGKSNEGQNLSGYKLVIKVQVDGKILYATDGVCPSVHSTHFKIIKSIFIVLPKEYNGENICELARTGLVSITPYIEAEKVMKLNERNYNICILYI
ncbi:MAG: hypothetical protein ACRDDY_16400, partial [Clostridium sp.]